MELPSTFVARLTHELGSARAEAVLATMREAKDVAYWINPLRCGATPAVGQPIPGLPGMFAAAASARTPLVRHVAAASGRIYLLNPSSALAVLALAPQPGDAVLDLAAAPGGKTLLAAARMGNRGSILAVDPIRARYFRLRANLDRCGVAIARCRRVDGRGIGRALPERFDRVLLDAPCSSEARMRAGDDATTRHWSPRKVREAAHKQRGLLRSAFAALKPGGTLVYCTCSFSRRENEATVDYLLRREEAASIQSLAFPDVPAATSGDIPGTVRVLPNRLFDGLFVAQLTKLLGRDVGD